MAQDTDSGSGHKGLGNGLGSNKVATWNPGSVGGYSRGLSAPVTGKVMDEKRPGAGAKQ